MGTSVLSALRREGGIGGLTMPTNEERCDIAARLRYVSEHGAPEWCTSACCIAECLGENDYPLYDGTEKLFSLLADLIEPEKEFTCEVIEYPTGEYGTACFACKICHYGWHISINDKPFSYCPNCGAKVVE